MIRENENIDKNKWMQVIIHIFIINNRLQSVFSFPV